MKKLIYGALLLMFAAPAFQSCIDDKESPSVTNVRDAKANELNGLAELYKAKAAAESANATANAAVQQAAAQKAAAEAALTQAQADWQKVQNELAAVQVEQEKVKLEQMQAELEAQIAEYKKRIQEAQNAIEKANAQLQLDLQNLKNQLLEQQITYIQKQLEYAQAAQTAEDMTALLASQRVTFWMNEFTNANTALLTAQGTVSSIQNQIAANQYAVNEGAAKVYQSVVNSNTKLINQYNGLIEGIQGILDVYNENYSYPTVSELFEQQYQINNKLIPAQKAYNEANSALSAAYNQSNTAWNNLYANGDGKTAYYVYGVKPFLQTPGVTFTGYKYDTKSDTYVGYYTAKSGNVTDTLFTDSYKYVVTQEGISSNGLIQSVIDYQVIEDFYTYNATGIENFIKNLTVTPYTQDQIKDAQELLKEYQGYLADAQAQYAVAQQTTAAYEAIYAPYKAEYDKLYAAAQAAGAVVGDATYQALLSALGTAQSNYNQAKSDSTYSATQAFGYEGTYAKPTGGKRAQYQADSTYYVQQNAILTLMMADDSYTQGQIKNQQTTVANALKQANASKAEMEQYMEYAAFDAQRAKDAYTQLTYVMAQLKPYGDPETEEGKANQALWDFMNNTAYYNARDNYNSAKGVSDGLAQNVKSWTNSVNIQQNYINQMLAQNSSATAGAQATLQEAYKMLQAQSSNVQALVAAYNAAQEAIQAAQLKVNQTYATVASLNGQLSGIQNLLNGSDGIFNQIQNLESEIAYYEQLIANCNAAIANAEVKMKQDIASAKEAIEELQVALEKAQLLLEGAQSKYDVAKANLEKAVAANGGSASDVEQPGDNDSDNSGSTEE